MTEKSQILTLNLVPGKNTSVLKFIKIFERINNFKVLYSFDERRKGDHPFVVADDSLAKSILNCIP